MSIEPAKPYRVELLSPARARIKRSSTAAIRLGIASEYAATLRAIHENLSERPRIWGDPLKQFPAAKLRKYQQLFDRLVTVCYVHEEGRVVFIEDIRPVLGHPLE